VITTDKKEVDKEEYVITVIGIPSLTTSKVIWFYREISELGKKSGLYLNCPCTNVKSEIHSFNIPRNFVDLYLKLSKEFVCT
jgi:hypothetical protein